MPSWYRTGTVNVVAGSPNVVGVGTLALTQMSVGDEWFGPDNAPYEVTTITDDTHWAIRQATAAGAASYAGGTLNGGNHAVLRNFTSTLPAQLAGQLADLMTKYHNTLDEFTAWVSGTGTVTVHDSVGNAYALQTPAALQASTNGYLSKSVAGGASVALSAVEAANAIINLTGAITANINVTVPDGTKGIKQFINSTTGAFSVTVKTVSGAGVAVAQGRSSILASDGTNISQASTSFQNSATFQSGAVIESSALVEGTAGGTVFRVIALAGGDGIRVIPFAAGSGAQIDAVNNANNAYAPLTIGGSVTNLHAAGTTMAVVSPSGLGVSSTIRTTGANAPTTGAGMELLYSGGTGRIQTYDRTGAIYQPLELNGLSVTMRVGASNALVGTWSTTGLSASAGLQVTKAADGLVVGVTKKLYFYDDGAGISVKTAASQAGTGFYIDDANSKVYTQISGIGSILQVNSSGIAVTGAVSTGTLVTGTASTGGSTVSVATGVATTLIGSFSAVGMYLVSAYVPGAGNSAYTAVGIIICDGGGSSGVRFISISNGANLSLSMSGNVLQVTQVSGSTVSVTGTYIRIA